MNDPQDQLKAVATCAASEWFALHRTGELSERERTEFVAWLRAAPTNMSEYLAIASLAGDLRSATKAAPRDLQELIELGRRDAGENVLMWRTSASPVFPSGLPILHRKRLTRIALAIVPILLGVAYFAVQRPGFLPLSDQYLTLHGEQRTVNLSDGSVMHLNSESRVSVRLSSRERLVDVQQGQVLFNVAHDPTRRFRVHAGITDVVALGTQFDVYRHPVDTVITVVDGVVEIYDDRRQPPPAITPASEMRQKVTPASPQRGLRVAAGKQVRIAAAGPQVPIAADADLHKATAWLQRQIVFDEEPLEEVIAEFNRYGQQRIEIDDSRLRRLRISGTFNAYDTESFLQFVGKLKGVEIHATSTQVHIQASATSVTAAP